ncbi:hypothetical protein ACMFMG_006821 [Clarireedia jacksonii]
MFSKIVPSLLVLATLASGASIIPTKSLLRAAGDSAASQISQIVPAAASCSNAPVASECATASQAAPYLIQAMITYKVTTAPEIGALISLMAFESGDFKYNINHFPGRPGQGTRNMQMPNFNLQYAASIAALSEPLKKITGGATTTDGMSDALLNQVRDLVTTDQYTWASAAWFYSTQCSDAVKSALQTGSDAGWQGYLTCVGVGGSETEARTAYWTRAKAAMSF